VQNNKKTEIHGHRGCRGYFPENTIDGFIHALGLNTDAIEMDVVVSKDLQIVVSHEPFMHHKKCLWPNLKKITKEEEKALVIFDMDYEAVKAFDCGLLPHPNFPLVKNTHASKPLLLKVIEVIENECSKRSRTPIVYNIEIKSDPSLIGKSQPDYDSYVNLVLEVIAKFKIQHRLVIQSFDKQVLRCIKKINDSIALSLLIEDELDPFLHIQELGFIPTILASDYHYLSADNILKLQSKNIKVFAFTVNKIEHINEMLTLGVDAIITDYTDIAARCLGNYKYPEK
jgi:glycerophosphoryl diester phosphodiesterase